MRFSLFVSSAIVLAAVSCGTPSERLEHGSRAVTSSCPEAKTKTGSLKIVNLLDLTDTYKVDGATDFGFPSNEWTVEGPHLIQSLNGDRVCKALQYTDVDDALFFCQKGGEPECTIMLKF